MKITSFELQWGASSLTFYLTDVPAFGRKYVAVEGTSWTSEDPPHEVCTQVDKVWVVDGSQAIPEYTVPLFSTMREVHNRLREACVEALVNDCYFGTITFTSQEA